MTPEKKAIDIFSKYMPDLVNELGLTDETYELNKKFALIAVNFAKENPLNTNGYNYYLDEVTIEIEKL